ncbi:MAG TPA: TonB-dependent receptor plug domain-containing protein [Opitutaceae bacterium]|nr:TonB-dependent receptor plug domain-containing protein [Opitutaceae bacterium]
MTVHLSAQTAPNPPARSAPPPEESNSEVIMLGTFDVGASNDHGYTSDETTSGTRIKANLRDLPFVVNVITSDFISDFAAFEFNDQVSNVSSLSVSEVQGQYQLRGFSVTTQLVDGFRRLGLVDSVNVDRIDVIKGPAASIYGYIQPGGVVNITTKRPLTHHEDSASVFVGDYDLFRLEAYSTGPLGDNGKVFYRADVSDQHRDFQQRYKAQSRYYGAFQILWKLDANTSLNFKVDDTFQHEHRGNQLLYLRTASTVSDPYRVFTSGAQTGQPQTISNYYLGLAYANNPYNAALYNFNNSGPGEYNDRRMMSGTLVFEHKINDVFSLRNGFNYFNRQYYRLYVDGLNYGIQAQSLSGQAPEFDSTPQRNVANQTDLTAKFKTGSVSHQMLLTLDFSDEVDRSVELRMDASSIVAVNPSTGQLLNPVTNITNFTNPNYGFVTYKQNPALYNQTQANYWDSVHDYGLFLNEHASMFHNRLNVIAGLRSDWINTKLDDYVAYNYLTNAFGEKDLDENIRHFFSHQLGISYRVIDDVTLFANQSNSINPQPNYVPGSGLEAPNSSSKGYEFGTKVSLFKNRLSFTLSHYQIHQYNSIYQISTTETLADGSSASVTGFMNIPEEVSTGDEVEAAWQPTKGLQLMIDYSYDEAKITQSNPYYLYLQGTPTRRVPANQFGSAARYTFGDGIFKGLYLVAKENYYSKSVVNVSGGRAATGSGFVNNPVNGGFPFAVDGVAPYAPVTNTNLTTRQTPATPNGMPDPQIVHLPDGREAIYNAPWATTDLGIGYKFKTGGYTHRLQLNVKNVFNRRYTYGSAIAGDPITYVVSYSLTY